MASLYQRGGMWWAKFHAGRGGRVPTGCTTKRATKDWLNIRAGRMAAGEPLPVRLDNIVYDELRADLDAAYAVKGIRSLKDATRRMAYLDTAFKGWRAVNLTESPSSDTRSGGRPSTCRAPTAPATIKLLHVPAITMLPEAQPRQGFIEEGDFRAIVAHLEPGPALAATIAFETAWRIRSEVLTLTWDRVDVAEGSIRLDGAHSKNSRPRTAYLSAETTRQLAAYRERVVRQLGAIPTAVFGYTSKGTRRGHPIRRFSKAWSTACRKAGYTGTLLHDLRRSGVRSMVRAGVPESVACESAGT